MPSGNDLLVIACFLATCHECNGLTWGGCGLHVESLLSTIPAGARICNCPIRRR
ncbi:hypothetical protein PGT21_028678 [Puccinia graminis f. sp. tritici]|uniref:Uncharacterized protein n=1 Tax=Puccinia graminis f. sp. tritici TaxID=56615 RepID=A0A5B0QKX7_PUCGR|nr:hypothetical protein PGT21_027375 [Puccinia graminis f. sp. tritici]KAA1078103.1 hypothetical protein PGT21_028678 [Puccinia graminis f. sp. tritici]KAA1113886.1 hypothetical protein PGTUg99_011565 [Puccinia graminis f. sp. tritici]KAA1135196.1 hypothetical protein PGTUg99_011985 [Puccinia graminis f. sp. tritici]